MQYNARKQQVIREIYDRAFVAAGLLEDPRPPPPSSERTHFCLFRVVKAEPGAVCPGEGTSGSRGGSPARSVHRAVSVRPAEQVQVEIGQVSDGTRHGGTS
jgi:hypothetical protein